MAKMIDVRTEIQRLLKTVASRVYFEVATDITVFPYVIFNFPNSVDTGHLENFVLDIDIWDDDQNTTVIETLCESVDSLLHRKNVVISDSVGFVIYRDNRINIHEDDDRIKRRKYVYQCRTYGIFS